MLKHLILIKAWDIELGSLLKRRKRKELKEIGSGRGTVGEKGKERNSQNRTGSEQ